MRRLVLIAALLSLTAAPAAAQTPMFPPTVRYDALVRWSGSNGLTFDQWETVEVVYRVPGLWDPMPAVGSDAGNRAGFDRANTLITFKRAYLKFALEARGPLGERILLP